LGRVGGRCCWRPPWDARVSWGAQTHPWLLITWNRRAPSEATTVRGCPSEPKRRKRRCVFTCTTPTGQSGDRRQVWEGGQRGCRVRGSGNRLLQLQGCLACCQTGALRDHVFALEKTAILRSSVAKCSVGSPLRRQPRKRATVRKPCMMRRVACLTPLAASSAESRGDQQGMDGCLLVNHPVAHECTGRLVLPRKQTAPSQYT